MTIKTLSRLVCISIFCLLIYSLSATSTAAGDGARRLEISSMKAMLFYEDKGTFSDDVSEEDTGQPLSPPKLWNTPLHYEQRSTSVFVVVEVSGDEHDEERRLEFTARYLPLMRGSRQSRPILVRKIVLINLPTKVGEHDKFHAGFWLYDTGCNPVRLTARIIGRGEPSSVKRVIRFDCGE